MWQNLPRREKEQAVGWLGQSRLSESQPGSEILVNALLGFQAFSDNKQRTGRKALAKERSYKGLRRR